MSNQGSLALISWPVTAGRGTRSHRTLRWRTHSIHFTKRNSTMEKYQIVEFSSLSETVQNLIKEAVEARERSYSPYSNFKVGAAILTEDEPRVFAGCNIESSAFAPSICAERAAIPMAVCAGRRRFRMLAVVAHQRGFTAPCGVCRQMLSEFRGSDGDMLVYLARPTLDSVLCTKLSDLLPLAFVSFQEDNVVT